MEEIKGDIDHGMRPRFHARFAATSLLPNEDSLEVRPALLVENHDLPIEDAFTRERFEARQDLGITVRAVGELPALEAGEPVAEEREGADPVPLDLEEVLLRIERRARARQHRRDSRRAPVGQVSSRARGFAPGST
jgi:hypothetical protein